MDTPKKIVLVVAYTGYQPTEYTVPKEILEKAGHTVITASNKAGIATAADSSTTPVDIVLDALSIDNYDAIFFIGGPGALDNLDNNTSYSVVQKAALRGIPYGAICIAPRILAKAGVMVAHEATGWDGDGELTDIFRHHGVLYEKYPVVTDRTCVTAVGPSAAADFAYAILALL